MKHRSWRKTAYQPTSLIAAVLLLLLIFVFAGYFFTLYAPGLSPKQDSMLAKLRENRIAWEEKRPPEFRYVVERQCECPLDYTEPFTVVEYLDEPDNQAWIDGFFTALEKSILDEVTVTVSYDPRFNYPNDFAIAAEQTFVRDFEVLRYADDGR